MTILALSLFLTNPAPLDMPRAESYLVRENHVARLEDRYCRLDLWFNQAMIGRWVDDDGRVFALSRLDACPPAVDWESTVTRAEHAAQRVPMKRVKTNGGFPSAFRDAVALLSPGPIIDRPRASRQLPHGYKDVYYWQNPTNYSEIVCSFRPEKSPVWYLASWKLLEGDDYTARVTAFEDQFLRREFPAFVAEHPEPPVDRLAPERELLRADARHSVAAYPNWHFSDSTEFAIIDDLPTRGFVETLTNDLPVMRAKYAAALPTPLDGSNVLCVARIYASRGEFQEALETDGLTNMAWSAAYWSAQRRELVAHLSEMGEQDLLRTIRHEAFHQYLSYAASMIPTSPWLNEGYAQYFEDEACEDWGPGFEMSDDEAVDRMALAIPGVLKMDYAQFYDGTDSARRLKYRLAWSIVRFIEKGADEVRLQPFKGLKERYFEALLETKNMHKATEAALKNEDTLKLFVSEWKRFWKKR